MTDKFLFGYLMCLVWCLCEGNVLKLKKKFKQNGYPNNGV